MNKNIINIGILLILFSITVFFMKKMSLPYIASCIFVIILCSIIIYVYNQKNKPIIKPKITVTQMDMQQIGLDFKPILRIETTPTPTSITTSTPTSTPTSITTSTPTSITTSTPTSITISTPTSITTPKPTIIPYPTPTSRPTVIPEPIPTPTVIPEPIPDIIIPEPIPDIKLDSVPSPLAGNTSGNLTDFTCPHGTYIKTLYGNAGGLIDGLGVICSNNQNLGKKGGSGGNQFRISSNTGFDKLEVKWGSVSIGGEDPLGKITMFDNNTKIDSVGDLGSQSLDLSCENDRIAGLQLYGNNYVTGLKLKCENDISEMITPPPLGDCPVQYPFPQTKAGDTAYYNNCAEFDIKYTGGFASKKCDENGSDENINFSVGKWLDTDLSGCELSCLADYVWPTTRSNNTAIINCKDAGLGPTFIGGTASRICASNGVWEDANYSTCEKKVESISDNITGRWRYQVSLTQLGDVNIIFNNDTNEGIITGIVNTELNWAQRYGYDKIKYQQGTGYIIGGNSPLNFINNEKNFMTNFSISLRKIETKDNKTYIGGELEENAPYNAGDSSKYREYSLSLR